MIMFVLKKQKKFTGSTKSDINILIISQMGTLPCSYGGVERYVYSLYYLLKKIIPPKMKIYLVIPESLTSSHCLNALKALRFEVIKVPIPHILRYINPLIKILFGCVLWFFILSKIYKRYTYILVHVQNLDEVALALCIFRKILNTFSRSSSFRIITTLHGRDLFMWLLGVRTSSWFLVHEILQRELAKSIDMTIFTSPLLYYYARRWHIAHKATVIPPVDLTLNFLSTLGYTANHDNIYFICVSRLDVEKNILTLLKAFTKFCKIYTRAKLIIIGDGVLRDELLNIIKLRKLHDNVKLKKVVDDKKLLEYISNSHFVIIPSPYEGFSLIAIEALALGKPIIIYKHIPSIVLIKQLIKNHINCLGILMDYPNENEILKALVKAYKCKKRFYSSECIPIRLKVKQYFNPLILAKKHLYVYFSAILNN